MKKINSVLISVFHKNGLDDIVERFIKMGTTIYSTGGTMTYLQQLGARVEAVEDLTSYPSILDGRVKTLHPKIFGGLLAKRDKNHLEQLKTYDIPQIDCAIVDLYPFEQTVASTDDEAQIIEKIDIGGISLIRAAAKNFKDVLVVPSQEYYADLVNLLDEKQGFTDESDRKWFASRAFGISSHYDTAIHQYFMNEDDRLNVNLSGKTALRYGENPHQTAGFYGPLNTLFDQLNGKAISYNNLVDIDAAVDIMGEFREDSPTFAVLKHTNPCGLATADDALTAWKHALAGDPVSAFGGILISNVGIDLKTAQAINEIFYEVLIAPKYYDDALELLAAKKKRIILRLKHWPQKGRNMRSLLNGVIVQDYDSKTESSSDLEIVTEESPSLSEINDLLFANRCVKHLKSNAIALVKDAQLVGMGCGQTSRVDALKQAILKARNFGLDLEGAVMASDAFFPFPDCVEIAHDAGIRSVIQPGGSIKDKDSIAFCDRAGMSMVFTGNRHFKH